MFELERRSKAQNIGNTNGYLTCIFNLRYNIACTIGDDT